ncbi:MAG: D-alanyl-D-alanine dipeptidase [Candidatus Anoxychlamydiales bacterium]|nr:D-alanyl-D-alanine dipeptidase [Candidatus Anoxychlamydiales bacterium]NGX36385.1 D-alanyl-D-alanine dipeptidase [Candidatus Anoxychlamydiales bacterium]
MSKISKIKNNDPLNIKEDDQLKLLVQFRPIIKSKKQLIDEIQQLSNPQVITWFIEKELRVDWFKYLRDDLIRPIRDEPKCGDPTFFLYDLEKWLLLNQKCDKTKLRISSKIQKIKNLKCPDIKFLYSADFFQFIKSNSQELKKYINDVIWEKRFFIPKASAQKLAKEPPRSNISIKKSYSTLRYLEGYFLIRKILEENKFKPGNSINIVFLLPNDEDLYYKNEDNLKSFQKNVCEMLRIEKPSFTKGQITIRFIPFEWNEKDIALEDARPYKLQAGKDIITNDNLELLTSLKNMVCYRDLKDILIKDCEEELLDIAQYLPEVLARYQQSDMYAYTKKSFFLRKSCIQMLKKTSDFLKKVLPNAKLLLVYAYRHPDVQQKYFCEQCDLMKQKYDFLEEEELFEMVHQLIAVPKVAGHPTGGAIDLTIQVEGKTLDMGTKIADFSDSEKIKPFSKQITDVQQKNRLLLRSIMVQAGFAPFDGEWWHFSYGDNEWAGYYKKPYAIYEQVFLTKK